MIPYRQMTPWWDNPPDYAYTVDDGRKFRQDAPAAQHVLYQEGGDPRTGPNGDIARDGTIPLYVPYGVINPARISRIPQ